MHAYMEWQHVRQRVHMGATTQLHGFVRHIHHSHVRAVLLTEQGHGACSLQYACMLRLQCRVCKGIMSFEIISRTIQKQTLLVRCKLHTGGVGVHELKQFDHTSTQIHLSPHILPQHHNFKHQTDN